MNSLQKKLDEARHTNAKSSVNHCNATSTDWANR
jgi:hypothetical protein